MSDQRVTAIRYSPDVDDRRRCRECVHLRGPVCSVARPGGIVNAIAGYRPALADELQRCKGFRSA